MMNFLHSNHSHVPDRELCGLNYRKEFKQAHVTRAAKLSYRNNSDKLFGIKCPSSAENFRFYDNVNEIYPNSNTKYIVGIRHPVEWFQSFYNFRVNNAKDPDTYPRPNEMIGADSKCQRGNLCTARSRFSHFLAVMGKTPMTSEDELALISNYTIALEKKRNIQNQVFLYNLDQLKDKNETRLHAFQQDLTKFVGFLQEKAIDEDKAVPGKKYSDEEQARRNSLKIDICEAQYNYLREVLMIEAKKSKQWIVKYFIESDEVTVSAKEFFIDSMARWDVDPCSLKQSKV